MKEIALPFIAELQQSLQSPYALIQVIMGPRQVGKTTGVLQSLKSIKEHHYVSADGDLTRPREWLFEQWELAKGLSKTCLRIRSVWQRPI